MASHQIPAAVSDQIMTELSFVHLSTGHALLTAIQQLYDPPLTTQHSYVPGTHVYIVPSAWLMTRGFPPPQKKVTHHATYLNINGRTSTRGNSFIVRRSHILEAAEVFSTNNSLHEDGEHIFKDYFGVCSPERSTPGLRP